MKVNKALVARWREKDDSVVLMDVDYFESDHLLAEEPSIYFMEPHYERCEIILARVALVDLAAIAMYIERRWRNVAPNILIAKLSHQLLARAPRQNLVAGQLGVLRHE